MIWVDSVEGLSGDKEAYINKNVTLFLSKNKGYRARGYELRVFRKNGFKILGEYGTLLLAKDAAESWVLAGMPMNVEQEYIMGPIKRKYRSYR